MYPISSTRLDEKWEMNFTVIGIISVYNDNYVKDDTGFPIDDTGFPIVRREIFK